jgi:membrane protein
MIKPHFTFKGFLSLLYEAGIELSRDFGNVHAAALSYYILLSIFPLAILAAIIITRIIGPAALSGDFKALLSNIVWTQYSLLLEQLITSSYESATNNVWTLLNILFLIYSSSYMFFQARISLDAMWMLTPIRGSQILCSRVLKRIHSLMRLLFW